MYFTKYFNKCVDFIEKILPENKYIEIAIRDIELKFAYSYSYILKYIQIEFDLVETFILIDGLFLSIYFIKDFILLKLSEKRIGKTSKVIFDYKSDIIKRYNKIYKLSVLDRYIFYIIIFINKSILNYFDFKILQVPLLFLVLPVVQNFIFNMLPLESYFENKKIFFRYLLSKIIISSIEDLHRDIIKIQNYHIFIIYNILSFDYIFSLCKNFLFISLLYYLKNVKSLYYYYKAIKMAYFYHTGYNFISISLFDSVDLANLVIKEERYKELSKMEVVNVIFVLISSKLYNENSSIYVSSLISMYTLFSIWSIIGLIKQISPLIFIFLSICTIITHNKKRNFLTCIICYVLLHFKTNLLIISFILINNNIVYYMLEQLYFFILNIKNIKKVIKLYKTKTTIDLVKTEKLYVFIT